MPEIAEVETVRTVLKRRILNKKIIAVDVFYNKMILNEEEYFKSILINNEFIDIKRRGKWLIFELKEHYLLSHLRMEGKFFTKDTSSEIDAHEHVIIHFIDHTDLRYSDTRKFGLMKIIDKKDLEITKEIMKQGLEPMDKNLNGNYLQNCIYNKNMAIKTVLLDQTIISGLGNIYADEVLFYAKINPLRKARDLSLEECNNIIKGVNSIISKSIEEGGCTIRSYTSSLGVKGKYQNYLMVHTKEDEECFNCHNKIIKIKVNGRGTYYCPNCQK